MMNLKSKISLTAVTLLLCLHSTATLSVAQSGYTTLGWQDLVNDSWERPMILPAPAENGHRTVDEASLSKNLQHKLVRLPGFMKPIEFTGNSVTGFLLVPFLKHHVRAHIHHDPNQMVYVSLKQPLIVENPFQPVWVQGEIVLESVETDEGPSGYTIVNATTDSYEY